MTDHDAQGRPAAELSDDELAQQGKQAHDTRNWVFLHGSAEQFARHTSRMLELEREYLQRFPKRTWQGSGGAPADPEATAEAWRETVRGIIGQLEALVNRPDPQPRHDGAPARDDAERSFLQRLSDAGGRMHKLEAHQTAREVSLSRAGLANLYRASPPALATDGEDRVLTDQGRAWLSGETAAPKGDLS